MQPGGLPPQQTAEVGSSMARQAAPAIVNRFYETALLGMLTSGFFAVLSTGFLDWPAASLAFAALFIRALIIAGYIRLAIPPRVTTAVAIAYAGFFALDFQYVAGTFLGATVHMIFFLAILKLLTASAPRDFGYLMVIGGLELIAAAVLSDGAWFLVYLTLFVLFAIAALASGEVRRAAGARVVVSRGALRKFPRRLGMLSGFLFSGIAVMTLALFLVLPRTTRAALGRFIPQRYHLSGFSNTVTLGDIGEIKQNSTPVLRVHSYQGETYLPVKWRGAALSTFDGTRWFNPPGRDRFVRVESGTLPVRSARGGETRWGRDLIYRVHVESAIAETLFFAGTPETITIDVPLLRYTAAGTFHVPPRYASRGVDYSVYAFLTDEWNPERRTPLVLIGQTREELLALPPLDARIAPLARQLTSGASGVAAQARLLEQNLRRNYGYTLEMLQKPVADPLAHFLFERKQGHCEYFASAMTVMLRTLGIPARVVTGFQSGTFNTITGWQVVRASDAHSWVEAWIEGRGWTTFDPTPPDPNAGSLNPFFSRLSMISDALSQYWQDWVVGYDLTRQVELASRMQATGRRFRMPDFDGLFPGVSNAAESSWKIGLSVIGAVGLIALLWFAAPWLVKLWHQRLRAERLRRGDGKKADATILYEQLLAALARRGFEKPAWLTPNEFVAVLPPSPMADLVADATGAYNELRFGGRPSAAPKMLLAIEQIRQMAL